MKSKLKCRQLWKDTKCSLSRPIIRPIVRVQIHKELIHRLFRRFQKILPDLDLFFVTRSDPNWVTYNDPLKFCKIFL